MFREIGAFIKSVFTHWLSGMCGAVTVPLTVFSPYAGSNATRDAMLATAAVSFLLSMFLAWRREWRRANDLGRQVASQGRLEIDYMPGERQFEEPIHGTYGEITRTLSVRIMNVGGAPVTSCRVYALSVEPNEGNLANMVRTPMSEAGLNPGDFLFLPISTFREPGVVSGDTMATLHIPSRPNGSGGERTIGVDFPYVVSLRATGAGSAACERSFKVWIEDKKLLRMQAA